MVERGPEKAGVVSSILTLGTTAPLAKKADAFLLGYGASNKMVRCPVPEARTK